MVIGPSGIGGIGGGVVGGGAVTSSFAGDGAAAGSGVVAGLDGTDPSEQMIQENHSKSDLLVCGTDSTKM